MQEQDNWIMKNRDNQLVSTTQSIEELEKAKDGATRISLKVKDEDGNEVLFKIKRSTVLKNLMYAYCIRKSTDITSIVFLYDGNLLRMDQSPGELGMEDGRSVIDAFKVATKPSNKRKPDIAFQEGSLAESVDKYTFDELEDRINRSFTEGVVYLEASFRKSSELCEAMRRTESIKEVLDAKVIAEKKVSERDLIIKKMGLENKELKQTNVLLIEERARLSKLLVQYQSDLDRLKGEIAQAREELENAKLQSRLKSGVSMENKDKSPTACSTPIRLIVKAVNGDKVGFKIRKNVELKELMSAYSMRRNKDFNSMIFLFKGRRISQKQTPNKLKMVDGDEIVAWLCLTGGAIC